MEFLKKNKSAYTLNEIIEATHKTYSIEDPLKYFLIEGSVLISYHFAIDNLLKSGQITGKTIKTDISGDSDMYYMAK